ncbi:MAG TPA: restriction endonuclease [Cellvibrionaceae bacterium]|nr:restriction endonuclease [Cellvibrionaceae bacterium]HMY38237.1 restriction endonuclease [Marinagarivorans sp.]HNG60115.1 restriction endonuclease [Cellvibrionaceae bacterium]
MVNDGKNYEQFVKSLQQALLDSEDLIGQKNIQVETNKKLMDSCGVEREFDVYWEYELAGITYKTVIECKDYKSSISVEKIDALIGKIRDLPDIKPIFATRTGYQSGAEIKAKANKIDLLIVRQQSEEDWQDQEGNPYIKEVAINMELVSPARIISFSAEIDRGWVKENTDIDTSKSFGLDARNGMITIEDVEKGEKYTVHQLGYDLGAVHQGESGEFIKTNGFINAFIYIDGLRLKLRSYTVRYSVSLPIIIPINIDYSKELLGVVEYLHRGTKTAVFANKIIKDW